MLQVVRGQRGPRPVVLLLRLLTVVGILLLGLPMPAASAAVGPPSVQGPYNDPTSVTLLGSPANDATPEWRLTDTDSLERLFCWYGQGTPPAPALGAGWSDCSPATPTGSPVSYSPGTPAGDGLYSLAVAESDGVGGFGPVTTSGYTYDGTAPVIDITALPSSADDTPTWPISVTDNSTVLRTCSVARGATPITPVSCTVGPTVDLTDDPEGSYVLTVNATDAAGNVAATATSTFVLDRVVGTVTVAAVPAVGTSSTAEFTVALPTPALGDPAYTITCAVTTTGGTPVANPSPACSPATIAVSVPLPNQDADYTLTVTAKDGVGTPSTGSATYARDTVAPTVTFTTSPSGSGQADSLTWAWTNNDLHSTTTAFCTLVEGGVDQAEAACTSPKAFTVTGQTTYALKVRVLDGAGTSSALTTSPTSYTRDTIVPIVTATAPASPSQQTSVAFAATVDDGTAVLECRLDRGATQVLDWGTCPTGNTVLTVDGSYTFSARATDDGQTGTASATYLLDRQPPSAVTISRSWTSPTGNAALTWNLSAVAAGDTRSCRFTKDSGTPGAWSSCATSVGFPAGATSGSYVLEVRDVDAALNETITADTAVVLDLDAPARPFVASGPSGTGPTASVVWTFAFPTGTPADPGTTFECQLRGPTAGSSFIWQACATPFPQTLTAQGSYVLDVRAKDEVGNLSALPVGSSATYLLDSVAPPQPTVLGPSGTGNTTAVTWTFSPDPEASTTDDPVSATCYRRVNGAVVETITGCTTPVVRTVSGEGSHRLEVVLFDAAGNVSPLGLSPTYLLDTVRPVAPTVTAVTGPPPSNVPSITWQWTAESVSAPGRVECRLLRDGLLLGADFGPSCTSPRTDSALADGSYVLQVRVIDAAGNTGFTGASSAYVVDTGAPAVPTFPSPPTGPSTTRDVTWTIAAESGSTLTCRLALNGATTGAFTACGTSYPVTGLADGSWVLQAIATDAATNASGVGSSPAYVVDTTGPAAPVVSGPSGRGRVRPVTWTWTTAEPTATAECQLTRNATVYAMWGSCATPYDVLLPDGDATWFLEVRLTDTLGNLGPVGTSAVYDLKTSLPGVPTVTGQASPSSDLTPVWTFSTEPATDAECRLVRAGVGGTFIPCGTPTTRDLTGLGDASYVLEVRLTDRHGNVGPVGAAAPYVLDTTAPTAPVFTTTAAGPSQDTTPTWAWSGEAGATSQCQLLLGGVVSVDWAGCASGFTPTLPSDGAWTLNIRLRDAALNTSGQTTAPVYVLDRVAPPAPVAVGPASPTNVTSATWTLGAPAAGDSRVCRVTLDGAGFTTFASCTTSVGPIALGADGSYRVEAVDTDAAGNVSATGVSLPLVLDTAAPQAPGLTGPSGTSSTADVVWTFALPSDATAECRLERDGVAIFDYQPCATPFPQTLTTDGSHVLRVRSVDAAGNRSGVTSSALYLLDRVAPAQPVVSGPSGDGNVTAVRWTFTSEAGAAVVCTRLRAGVVVETVTACASPVDRTLTPDGTWRLQVVVTDAAGNISATGVSADYRLDTVRPVAPPVTGATGPTSSTTATWAVSAEPGVLECRLRRDGVVIADWATPCVTTRNLTGDGGYEFDARVIDAAGNVGDTGTSPVLMHDTIAPTVPVVSGLGGQRNVSTVTWMLTVDSGTTQECRLVLGGTAAEPFAPCTSPVTRTLPSDGDWQLEVVSYDGARNASAPGFSPVYSLDTVAPAAPAVSGPSGTSNVTAVSYSFVLPPGHTAACVLRRGGVTVVDLPGCTSPVLRTLGADGSYVLGVRLTDAAGNTGPEGTSPAYLLDTVAPAAPVVTGALGPAQSRTPSWTIAGGAASGTCRVLRGLVVVVDATPCLTGFTADLLGQPDGGYVLEVVTVDAAGNASAAGTSAPYVLDTTAPDAPVVSGPTGPSPDSAPVFTFTGEAGTTAGCRYVLAGSPPGALTACTSPTTAALAGDGSWTLEVQLTDAAGNVSLFASSSSYLLDTTAPVAPVVTPPAPIGRDRLPTWGVLAEAGATLECRLTGTGLLRDWRACTAPVDVDLTGLPDGSYVLSVRATDKAGLTSPVGSGTYLLDTVAPAAPVVTVVASGRTTVPSFAFTSEPGTTATCRLSSGTTLIGLPVTCVSPTPVDLAGLADGPYNLNVRLTDEAGNTGFAGLATYVLDTTGPETPVFTARPASPSPDRFPSWSFRIETGSTPSCRLVFPTGAIRDLPGCGSPLSVDLTGLPDGTYTLQVRAVDAVGNTSAAASDPHVLDASSPAVPVVTVQQSPSQDGTPIWRFTTPAGTTTQCRLTAPSGEVRLDWTRCADTFEPTLFGLPDGPWRLAVRAVTATTTSAAGVATYLYDTTAPLAPGLLSPPTPSTVVSPIFTVSSPETGATAECRLLLFGREQFTWRSCPVSVAGSQFALTLPGDGSYVVEARVIDAAGNTGPAASAPYELVRSAPPAVSVTSPASPGSDTSPTWVFTTAAGTTLECRVTGPTGDVVPLTTCQSPFTVELANRPDGNYALTVHAVNAAGAVGPDTTTPYELLTAAPAAPTTPVGPPGPDPDRSPTWTFSLPAGTTGVCTVFSTLSAAAFVVAACDGTFVLDLTRAQDAIYTLTVVAVNVAGVPSLSTAPVTYELLTRAPVAPVFTQSPGSPSSTTDPVWAFAIEPGATAECRLMAGARALETFASCTSPKTALLSAQPDGAYTLEVRAVNAAGPGPAVRGDYVLDRSALPLPVIVSAPVTPDNDKQPAWTLASPDPALTLQCALSSRGGTFAACGPTYVADLTAAGNDVTHVLSVRLVDATGRIGAAVTSSYVLDTTPPAPPTFISPLVQISDLPQASWHWAPPVGTDVIECQLRREGVIQPGGWVVCNSSPHKLDLTKLGQATYALELRTRDLSGNLSSVVAGTYRFDDTPPPAPVVVKAPATTGTGTAPTWTFRTSEATSVTCTTTLDGVGVDSRACTTSYVMPLAGEQPGNYVFSITVADAAGNDFTYELGGYTLQSAQSRVDTPVARPRPPVFIDPPPGPTGPPGGGPTAGEPPVPDPVDPGVDALPPRSFPDLTGSTPSTPSAPGGTGGKQAFRGGSGNALADNLQVPRAIADAVTETFKKPTLPLALLVIVVLFLLVQNRIDRRDPKLSGAPALADDDLEFGPAFRPGGAPA